MSEEKIKLLTQVGVIGVFTIVFCVGFFMGLIGAEAFLSLASGIIGYYFADRKNSKELDTINSALKVRDAEIQLLNAEKK